MCDKLVSKVLIELINRSVVVVLSRPSSPPPTLLSPFYFVCEGYIISYYIRNELTHIVNGNHFSSIITIFLV